MNEIDRLHVKTELYDFAKTKLDQYGDSGIDLTVISLLEVTTELGINAYGIDETLDMIDQLRVSLVKMKKQFRPS